MIGYYVVFCFDGGKVFDRLAGPFPSEAAARKYEHAAVDCAMRYHFDLQFEEFGVLKTDQRPWMRGRLNETLNIPAAELGLEFPQLCPDGAPEKEI